MKWLHLCILGFVKDLVLTWVLLCDVNVSFHTFVFNVITLQIQLVCFAQWTAFTDNRLLKFLKLILKAKK